MVTDVLLDNGASIGKVVKTDGVEAIFVKAGEDTYDITLNVNSQKFMIRLVDDSGQVDSFEIVSIKGYIQYLTSSLILALKNLVVFLKSKL